MVPLADDLFVRAGVGSWGRWAARASVDTSGTAEGDDLREETVGDQARVAAGDVAVGLIRMGILPRIRFMLEVSGLFQRELLLAGCNQSVWARG